MPMGGRTPRGVHDKPPHRGGPSPTAAVSLCAWLAWLAWPGIMAHQARLLSRRSCQGPQTCSLHTLFRFRRGPSSVTPLQAPLPRPPFACFDGLQVLAQSVLLWLRLHQVSTSSYLPFAIPTIVRASPLTVLSGIILSFSLGDLPVPGHPPAAPSFPPALSCPKPAIPSLVIAESVCYMRKRGQQA